MRSLSSVFLIGCLLSLTVALPTREQILELYHRAPQHIKDALARHGIHAHNLPSPASLANLHTSSLIANHPGLATGPLGGRLNLHALASRAQAILKRPPSQLPFPIPSFNKNAAQFQRRSGLVLPFPIKNEKKEALPTPQALSGPPPQIVTVPPMIEGLQQNTHIKPVSTILNFGPALSSSSSSSDGIITGRPMREGQLPVKPQTPPPATQKTPQQTKIASQSAAAEQQVVSARSFSIPFDSGNDNILARPYSLPLNVRNPKYEYGGFVPISSSNSGSSNSISSPSDSHNHKKIQYANGFVIEDEPAVSSSRISGPVVPGAVVRDVAPYNLVKKTTALVEDCQLKKQDFCIVDDETYPKLETEHFLRKCDVLVDAMYVRIPQNATQGYQKSLCEADRKLKRLSVARDIHGQWAVIVQAGRWPQKAHMTLCRDEGKPCQRLGGCSVRTKCVQKFAPQTLIALDPLNPESCPTLRVFSLPSGCECHSADY